MKEVCENADRYMVRDQPIMCDLEKKENTEDEEGEGNF
jgi:hypothetical protein